MVVAKSQMISAEARDSSRVASRRSEDSRLSRALGRAQADRPAESEHQHRFADHRSEITMDDESYQSFPATAEDSRQRSRRRNHSIHVQSQTYGLLPLGLATPVGSTFLCRVRLPSTATTGPVLILIIVFILVLVVPAEDVCNLFFHSFECAFGLVLGTVCA